MTGSYDKLHGVYCNPCYDSEGTEPLHQRIQGQHSAGGQTDLRHAEGQVHQGAPRHQLQEVMGLLTAH